MGAPVRTALELAPNDWDANRMAAAESTEFRREAEMYASIRKCFMTNPHDSWAPYELALICWTVDAQDLADKWMQRAINLEPDPQRRRLMECERMVYQGEYAAALPAAAAAATGFENTLYDGRRSRSFLFHAGRRLARRKCERSETNSRPRARIRLPCFAWLWPNMDWGQESEARATSERAVASAEQKLSTAKSPRWMRFDLAVGSRLLNHLEDAYRHLQDLLANGGFPDPVLGPKDPGLDLFKPDNKFQE